MSPTPAAYSGVRRCSTRARLSFWRWASAPIAPSSTWFTAVLLKPLPYERPAEVVMLLQARTAGCCGNCAAVPPASLSDLAVMKMWDGQPRGMVRPGAAGPRRSGFGPAWSPPISFPFWSPRGARPRIFCTRLCRRLRQPDCPQSRALASHLRAAIPEWWVAM